MNFYFLYSPSILQGRGGPECDFIPTMTSDSHVTFESLTAPGSHIGVLPSGQITSPAQTNKLTDASHFRIKYLVSCHDIACILVTVFIIIKYVNQHKKIHILGFIIVHMYLNGVCDDLYQKVTQNLNHDYFQLAFYQHKHGKLSNSIDNLRCDEIIFSHIYRGKCNGERLNWIVKIHF